MGWDPLGRHARREAEREARAIAQFDVEQAPSIARDMGTTLVAQNYSDNYFLKRFMLKRGIINPFNTKLGQ